MSSILMLVKVELILTAVFYEWITCFECKILISKVTLAKIGGSHGLPMEITIACFKHPLEIKTFKSV